MLKTLESNTILNKIIDSMKELKGMDIVLLDLRKIETEADVDDYTML